MSESYRLAIRTARDMHQLGESIGRIVQGGDVLVLTGQLGAGKTTLTQGIAVGMGIDERVTSPTFVIARIHDSPTGGPSLAHVDAYRLGSIAELDDLDLDADLERSVVVVEWGAGLVDDLSEDRIDISIVRSDSADDETRTVELTTTSPRWADGLSNLTEGRR
jgi:tRNA threonylcarbamoyladenosine biosynthesis protein TsaE